MSEQQTETRLVVDFDVETTGLQPWSGTQHAFLYQFLDNDGLLEVLRPENDWDRIQWWFDRVSDDPDAIIRAWNSKFDRSFAYAAGFKIPGDGQWDDGMIWAHAINENRSVALKAVATEVLGQGSDDLQKRVKEWLTAERRRRKSEATKAGTELVEPNYSDVPDELMEEYGAEDVVLTQKVCANYEPIINRTTDLANIVAFERDVLDALWHVERRGMPADEEGYRRLEVEVIENVEKLDDNIQKVVDTLSVEDMREALDNPNFELEDFNQKSSAQVLAALKVRGVDMEQFKVTTDKFGRALPEPKYSADVEHLSKVSKEDELAAAILEFRAEFKALTTYIQPYIGRSYVPSLRAWKEPFIASDGRIHANFRQVGTKTGRMSCSDPNLQNQPRDDLRLRYNMRAEPGYKLVTCDLSNVEMRIFAAYAGNGALLDTIREGGDIHVLTAEMIGIRDKQRAGGAVETARQRGKTFNFSMVYGGGLPTIMKQQGVTRDEARLLLQRYKDAYPEVVRLQNRVAYRISDTGYIKSAWGRRFHIPERDSHKAVNYLVQGTAADLLKASLVRLHQQGIPIVACVHDEIVAHVPEDEAEEVRDLIIAALTDHPKITDKVPLDAEGDIVDRWSDAKPLEEKDENGDKTGRYYYFDPKWANVERRYLDA